MRALVPDTRTTLLSTPSKLRVCPACTAPGAATAAPGRCAARCRECDMRLAQVHTFSLPAVKSCPGSVMENNWKVRAPSLWTEGHAGICDSCYADGRGNYRWNKTKLAQAARYAWLHRNCATEEGRAHVVSVLVNAIRDVTHDTKFFRIHESGDFFSPYYVWVWTEVARQLPDVTFWAPTRTWHFMDRPLWRDALTAFAALPNVVCRPSALQFDMPAPVVEGMQAGTTAHMLPMAPIGHSACPAAAGGHNCGPCTTCWTKPQTSVSYQAHTLQSNVGSAN